MNNVIQQFKGAMKFLFIIQILIAVLTIWILKDNRHVSFYIHSDDMESIIVDKHTLSAFEAMK